MKNEAFRNGKRTRGLIKLTTSPSGEALLTSEEAILFLKGGQDPLK